MSESSPTGSEQPPRNIRLIIAYQGTRYSGWQIQPNAPTVQGALERRLEEMTGHFCRVRAAGRTDAGVHALGQVANFNTTSSVPLRGFLRGLNTLLPDDIGVLAVEEVAPDFDSRRNNHGKHYRYSLWNQRPPSPREVPYYMHIHKPLDLRAMAEAGRLLVGTHDFAAFRAANCERETTVRTIFRCTICHEAPLVHIDVMGSAFLKNMVRIITGTLLEVGRGKHAPSQISALLEEGDRTKAGMTVPPQGLCMMRVFL